MKKLIKIIDFVLIPILCGFLISDCYLSHNEDYEYYLPILAILISASLVQKNMDNE